MAKCTTLKFTFYEFYQNATPFKPFRNYEVILFDFATLFTPTPPSTSEVTKMAYICVLKCDKIHLIFMVSCHPSK